MQYLFIGSMYTDAGSFLKKWDALYWLSTKLNNTCKCSLFIVHLYPVQYLPTMLRDQYFIHVHTSALS